MKIALITGITGQVGPYLSKLLIEKNYKVIGLTRSYTNIDFNKLKYLGIEKDIIIEECDLTDAFSIFKILKKYSPSEIYNLAAQSSVGLSFEQPIGTIQFNVNSVLNLLECIRMFNPDIRFYQASSSEMFGKVNNLPIKETTPLHPLSPYAISKATGYWTVINYRESFNLFAANGILFNHESYLRSSNFFVKKVISEAIQIKKGTRDFLKVGNINIRRDFGYAPEYAKAMWLVLNHTVASDFLICSGKSISLKEIVNHVFDNLNIDKSKIIIDQSLFRPSEILDIYGDSTKAKEELNWHYDLDFFKVLDILIEEELKFGIL